MHACGRMVAEVMAWGSLAHAHTTCTHTPHPPRTCLPRHAPLQTCFICRKRHGAPIQCANKNCFAAFHVSCARKAKFYMKAKAPGGEFVYKAYCDRHTPREYREVVDVDVALAQVMAESSTHYGAGPARPAAGALPLPPPRESSSPSPSESEFMMQGNPSKIMRIMDEEEEEGEGGDDDDDVDVEAGDAGDQDGGEEMEVVGDQADAQAPEFVVEKASSRSPVVPAAILAKLLARFPQQLPDFLVLVCKYWSLKRLYRRGAPLLKRLHLEVWRWRWRWWGMA
jgi:hypothetical protein